MGVNQPYLGIQMICVPSCVADQVASVEDMKKPEVAAMFDEDGYGKGEYWVETQAGSRRGCGR